MSEPRTLLAVLVALATGAPVHAQLPEAGTEVVELQASGASAGDRFGADVALVGAAAFVARRARARPRSATPCFDGSC